MQTSPKKNSKNNEHQQEKIMKKFFSVLCAVIFTSLLSSCVFIAGDFPDDYEYGNSSSSYSKVFVKNQDSDRSAYIQSVEYKKSSSSSWKTAWKYSYDYSDSNCNFKLYSSGFYDFRIRVIYPDYYVNADAYCDYYTDLYNPVYISSKSDIVLIFDGECLYEK